MLDDTYNAALRALVKAQLDNVFTTMGDRSFPVRDSNTQARVAMDALLSAYLTYSSMCGLPPDGVAYALRQAANAMESGEARAMGEVMAAQESGSPQGVVS